jgi:hypothetical protein
MSNGYLAINRLDAVPFTALVSDLTGPQDTALIELAYVQGMFWHRPQAIALWHQTPEETGEPHQRTLLAKVLGASNAVQRSLPCPSGMLHVQVLKLGLGHTAVATRFDDTFTSGCWNVWEVWF